MPLIPYSGQPLTSFWKRADVRISSAWPSPVSVPPALHALTLSSQCVFVVELFAQVVDRSAPPSGYGFSLAEGWAFARYFGAVAAIPEFSLSLPWEHIDTHQKTILSDDWGVGVAGLIATSLFQPAAIANTGEWLRHCGSRATAMREPKKRGPAKTPDFVLEDASGRFHFVEAKGTQGTTADLEKQMHTGQHQKNNIKVHDLNQVGTRLVVGTRIPLEGDGRLEVVVDDPPITDRRWGTADRARAWLRRVGLAGACRAAGLPTWATALLSEEGFRGGIAEEAAREFEVRTREMRSSAEITGREVDLILPRPLEGRGREWRVAVGMPNEFLIALLDAPDLDAELLGRMTAPAFPVVPAPSGVPEPPPRGSGPLAESPGSSETPNPRSAPDRDERKSRTPRALPTVVEEDGRFTASTPNMLHLRVQEL